MVLNNKTRVINPKTRNIVGISIENKISRIMGDKDRMGEVKNREDQDRIMIIGEADPKMIEIIIDYLYTNYILINIILIKI